jgi:hypothetical protein
VALGVSASVAAEVVLTEPMNPSGFVLALDRKLPEGLRVLEGVSLDTARAVPVSALVWRFSTEPIEFNPFPGPEEGLPAGTRVWKTDSGALQVRVPSEGGREPPGVRALARALFGAVEPRILAGADLVCVEFEDGR